MTTRNRIGQAALAAAVLGFVSVSAFAQPSAVQIAANDAAQISATTEQAVPVWVGQPPKIIGYVRAADQNASEKATSSNPIPGLYTGWQHH